jgi:hypothetical protein
MIACLVFAAVIAPRSFVTVDSVSLIPTDDVWAYPHAGDPAHDSFLRVWGTDGRAAAKDAGELEQFSYGLLQFDATKLPNGKPSSAFLRVYNVSSPSFTLEQAKAAPLQVRPINGTFIEKTWQYAQTEKLMPPSEDKAVFGQTSPTALSDSAPILIEVDLLKGPGDFAGFLANVKKTGKSLNLALTSALEVTENRASYKIYSRDAERESLRPQLVLTY